MLEIFLSKREILQLYMNRIYLGGGIYGVEAMSRRTFGKPASDLTLGEAALLAGVIRAPALVLAVESTRPRARQQLHRAQAHARGREDHRRTGRGGATRDVARAAGILASEQPASLREGIPATAVQGSHRRRQPAGLEGAHDLRAGSAGRGRNRRAQRSASPQRSRSAGGAGRDRSAHRKPSGDRRRIGLSDDAVQSRGAQPSAAWIGIQAVRVRRGARAGALAGVDAERAAAGGRAGARRRLDSARRSREDARHDDAARGAARVEQRRRRPASAARGRASRDQAGERDWVCPISRMCRRSRLAADW